MVVSFPKVVVVSLPPPSAEPKASGVKGTIWMSEYLLTMMADVPRATPKSVEERRREIITAAWPLIAERGMGVSTKRIADAVGIAEGTLFRVFPTKRALIHAAMTQALDPTQLVAELDAIGRTLPLVERIGQVLVIIQRSTEKTRALMLAIREQTMAARADGAKMPGWPELAAPGHGAGPGASGPAASAVGSTTDDREPGAYGRHDHAGHNPAAFRQAVDSFRVAVERVLAPDQNRLAVDLGAAASFILIFCMSYLMPPLSSLSLAPDLAADLIARALLDPGKESQL